MDSHRADIRYSAEHVAPILIAREAYVGILSKNIRVLGSLGLDVRYARLAEAKTCLHSAQVYRSIGALQESLSSVTYLAKVAQDMSASGATIEASVAYETANVLWNRGELVGAIKTLQSLNRLPAFDEQVIPVGKAGLLADLVSRLLLRYFGKVSNIVGSPCFARSPGEARRHTGQVSAASSKTIGRHHEGKRSWKGLP